MHVSEAIRAHSKSFTIRYLCRTVQKSKFLAGLFRKRTRGTLSKKFRQNLIPKCGYTVVDVLKDLEWALMGLGEKALFRRVNTSIFVPYVLS